MKGWHYPCHVLRIYYEDRQGRETDFQQLAAVVMLELEWDVEGEKSTSRVKLHEEGKIWYRYADKN